MMAFVGATGFQLIDMIGKFNHRKVRAVCDSRVSPRVLYVSLYHIVNGLPKAQKEMK
jgi:hypothetical protein